MFDKQVHELNMKKILKEIFTSEISDFLGFKGGTLAYFCYGLDRFSTDIDIDILDLGQEDKIINIVRESLYKLGDVKNETLGKTLHRWIFRYDDDRSMNIKVELNKRIWQNNSYDYQVIDGTKIHCMKKESIFANKLVALYERMKNRDLYDIHFFLENNFPLNEKIIIERTGKNKTEILNELVELLPEHYQTNNILAELGEVLTDPQKIWMKNRAVDETIELLKNLL